MIPLQKSGQLAQLVEHLLDVQGVRGSSPLLSTIYKTAPNGQKARNGAVFCFLFPHIPARERANFGTEMAQ